MSQTPQDSANSAKTNGRAPKGGTAVVVTVVGLMAAVAILLLLLVLRTNERGGGAVFPVGATAAPKGPMLLVSDTTDIEKWMTSAMKTSGAEIGLVNVWATWCEPCRDEMPELAKFQALSKEKPVPVFLVSADNETDVELARSFLASAGVNFESTLIKGDQQIFIEAWREKSSKDANRKWSMTLPVTFVINASAEVLSFHVGTSDASGFKAMVENAKGSAALDTAHD